MPIPQPNMPMPPEDVLSSFFGGRTESDPLTLAKLRGQRISEAQNRLVADTRAGDARDAGGTTALLKMLQGEADADPDTGVAAHAAEAKIADAEQQLAPGPVGDLRKHNEAIALQKSLAEHPPQNVSPFSGSQIPRVPGAISGSAGGAQPVDPSAAIMAASSGPPVPEGVDPEAFARLTGDLSPEAAAKVAQLLRYDIAPPTGNALARPEWSTITGRAAQIDPTLDMKTYPQRQAYLKTLADGRVGGNKTALDQLMHHMNNLDESAMGLGNSGGLPWSKPWNAFTNSLLDHTSGNPKLGRFNADAQAVADELSKVFKGDVSTDHEIRGWRDQLSSSSTPDEFKGKLSELANLVAGRLAAAQHQYKSVMGRPAPDFFSPESRQAWEGFQSKYGGVGRSASPAQPLPPGVSVRPMQP